MAVAPPRKRPAERFRSAPLALRLAAIIGFAFLPLVATAQEDDVRVVLPFGEGEEGEELERVGTEKPKEFAVADLCRLIAASADAHALPKSFFARLIWKESRFDINAVSPAGARGIAQFMPATALRRKLRNPFDPEQALPASAAYLSDLRQDFGNLGLAAAAYNAGENRVSGWIDARRTLPLETEDYVLTILGKPADSFIGVDADEDQPPLQEDKSFDEACRDLPVMAARMMSYAETARPPWGVQVAGHFNKAVAMKKWNRLRASHASVLGEIEPAVFRAGSPRGRRDLYVVQVAAANKGEAESICLRLRSAGGTCIVKKN